MRELEDDPTGYHAGLWARLADLDLTGLLVPEEHGGSGMTALEGVVLYEELGRALAPTPHFASCVAGAGAGGRRHRRPAGGVAARHRVRRRPPHPRLAGARRGFGPTGVRPRHGRAGRPTPSPAPSGTSPSRPPPGCSCWPAPVTGPVTSTCSSSTRRRRASRSPSSSRWRPTRSTGSTSTVSWSTTTPAGAPGTGWDTWAAVRDDALILLAAWAVGAAGYVQEITVQYAKDREQFDKPIGAFQAIAHYLADRQAELDGARTLVHEAAWARATGRSVARLAPMAKLFACRTARRVTATAQQIHGGNGFTLDYDVQLYFRRARRSSSLVGQPRPGGAHRRRRARRVNLRPVITGTIAVCTRNRAAVLAQCLASLDGQLGSRARSRCW